MREHDTFSRLKSHSHIVRNECDIRTLLETTDKLLTDIAAETGFYDHAHFVKTFKRIVGTTPSRYRKQHWQGQS